MVGVIVTFKFDDGFDRAKVEGVAREAAPMFEGVPGLRSKLFTLDEGSGRAVNVYLWESREEAAAFFTPELVERATAAYGIAPSVEFFDVAALVDNSRTAAPVA
ncbi:MAG TPA: YdhR family protein [Gaiellaceae bacterium]|nr:YdhR family protein [Gaiellaceae bacterium]